MLMHYSRSITERNPWLFDAVQDSFPKRIINFIINSKTRRSVNLKKWCSEFMNELPSDKMKEILRSIPDGDDYDMQVINCLQWVIKNIKYIGDPEKWKIPEYWQTPEETIQQTTYPQMSGDCEDGAILLYYLCRMKGVPANRLNIIVSSVEGGRHCYLGYKAINYPLNYCLLDWCYWTNTNSIMYRNKFYFDENNQIHEYTHLGAEVKSKYYIAEFSFNENTSWTKFKYNNKNRTVNYL